MRISLVVLLRVQNAQDSKEEIDNIQIKGDCRCDLFLDVVVAHDQLGINEDISAEYETSNDAITKLDFAIVGEEGSHETFGWMSIRPPLE